VQKGVSYVLYRVPSLSCIFVFVSDIDECVIETHTCGRAQFCENVAGGFRCHDDYDDMMTSERDYELHDDEYQLHDHAAGTSHTNQPSDDRYQPTDRSHLATPTCSPGFRYDPTSQSCDGKQHKNTSINSSEASSVLL